jgi:hypothetical protein
MSGPNPAQRPTTALRDTGSGTCSPTGADEKILIIDGMTCAHTTNPTPSAICAAPITPSQIARVLSRSAQFLGNHEGNKTGRNSMTDPMRVKTRAFWAFI